MTRDEFEKAIDKISLGCPFRHIVNYLKDHDAEQRARIERLEEKVKSYEGGCPHDSLGDQACTLEQQAQEIARLREALENIVEGEGLWTKNDMAHEAQQALKETGK